MNDDIVSSLHRLTRAGAEKTGHSMHYNEGNSGTGWQHITITIHPPEGELIAWYASVDPDSDDTPLKDDEMHITLRQMRERLTDYIAANRKEAA